MSASKWNSYPNYTESNSEFIPQYPSHWELKRMQWIGKFSASGIDKKSVETESDCFMVNYTDVYGNETAEIHSNQEFMKTTATSQKITDHHLKKGDILFTPSSETADDIGVSAVAIEDMLETVYSYHLTRFRPSIPLGVDFSRFFSNSTPVLSQLTAVARGTTRQILSRDDFNTLNVAIPPEEERKKIGQFLYDKTKQITAIIQSLENNTLLLGKKRSATITQAVTKGLNPDVPMKDSGIDWIGKIPNHWEIKPLRYIGKCQNGISAGAEYFGHGSPFVNYKDVYDNPELPFSVDGLADSSVSEQKTYSIKRGDVLFTRTSETVNEVGITSTCIRTIPNSTFAGFLIRVRPQKDILLPEFSKYFFRSNHHRTFFTREMNIVTRASLSQELLKRLPVFIPSMEEQKQISDYLESKTRIIDEGVKSILGKIEQLKEFRIALISAAITGKIDVRESV